MNSNNNVAAIYMRYRPDKDGLKNNPLILSPFLSDDTEAALIARAHAHSMYTEIIRVAIVDTSGTLSQAVTDSASDVEDTKEDSAVKIVGNEEDLVRWVCNKLVHDPAARGGSQVLPYWLAGWRLTTQVWPRILGRLVYLRERVPFDDMLPDPGTKWFKSRNLVDIDVLAERIYDVDVRNVLRSWGFYNGVEGRTTADDMATVARGIHGAARYWMSAYNPTTASNGTSVTSSPLSGKEVPEFEPVDWSKLQK